MKQSATFLLHANVFSIAASLLLPVFSTETPLPLRILQSPINHASGKVALAPLPPPLLSPSSRTTPCIPPVLPVQLDLSSSPRLQGDGTRAEQRFACHAAHPDRRGAQANQLMHTRLLFSGSSPCRRPWTRRTRPRSGQGVRVLVGGAPEGEARRDWSSTSAACSSAARALGSGDSEHLSPASSLPPSTPTTLPFHPPTHPRNKLTRQSSGRPSVQSPFATNEPVLCVLYRCLCTYIPVFCQLLGTPASTRSDVNPLALASAPVRR